MPRSRIASRARRGQRVELVVDRKFGVDDLLAASRAREQVGQPVIVLRADHQIDARRRGG